MTTTELAAPSFEEPSANSGWLTGLHDQDFAREIEKIFADLGIGKDSGTTHDQLSRIPDVTTPSEAATIAAEHDFYEVQDAAEQLDSDYRLDLELVEYDFGVAKDIAEQLAPKPSYTELALLAPRYERLVSAVPQTDAIESEPIISSKRLQVGAAISGLFSRERRAERKEQRSLRREARKDARETRKYGPAEHLDIPALAGFEAEIVTNFANDAAFLAAPVPTEGERLADARDRSAHRRNLALAAGLPIVSAASITVATLAVAKGWTPLMPRTLLAENWADQATRFSNVMGGSFDGVASMAHPR